MGPARRLVGALTLFWCGCTTSVDFFSEGVGSDGGAGQRDDGADAGELVGEAIRLGGTTPERCAASLAAAALRQALCTCTTLAPQGSLRVLDDASRPGQPPVASVASNGGLNMSGAYNVAGALHALKDLVASAPNADGFIQSSLRVGGNVAVWSPLEVRGDAFVVGSIGGPGPIEIAGTLYIPQGALYPPGIADRVSHDINRVVTPPCGCDATLVPVAALVSEAATRNDNARIGLDALRLVGSPAGRRLDLPAGRFFVSGISTLGTLVVAVHGPAALFVDGAVLLGGTLDVRLDPGASLDLLFTGDLLFSADESTLGSLAAPSRVRLWASTTGQLSVSSSRSRIGAGIHAPGARLSAPSGAVIYGAALVRDVKTGFDAVLEIHYDRALLGVGKAACGTPAATPLL